MFFVVAVVPARAIAFHSVRLNARQASPCMPMSVQYTRGCITQSAENFHEKKNGGKKQEKMLKIPG